MKYLAAVRRHARTDSIVQLALDCLPDEARRIGAVELVDGDDAGRRGDVDLGQPLAADHVDPDEEQSAALQLRTEHAANLLLARRQLGLRRSAADREVGADFARAGHAIDRSGDLAVDEDDALVAVDDLREEFLDDVGLAIGAVEELDQRREVPRVGTDAEDRASGEAVQRLDHDLAMLGEEL